MIKKRIRVPIVAAAIVLLLLLVFQTAAPSYASVTIDSTAGIEVTSYTITPATGSITRGNDISVSVTIFDTRVTSLPTAPPAPNGITVSLSTPSFTNRGNITPGTPTLVYDTASTPAPIGCEYTITFSSLRYTGTGNKLAFNISYANLATPVAVGTVTLTIGRCVPYVAPPAPEQPKPPEPGPPPIDRETDFVLKDARFGDGTVYAGDEFALSVTILTTNGTFPVENVSVTFTPPEQFTLAGGASVVYIGTMAPNTTRSVSILLFPSANIAEGSYPVSVSVTGVNQQPGMAPPGGGQMTVSIPVLQPERFEIFDAMLPTDLTAGVDDGLGFSTVTLVNKGKGTVANVTVEISGDGLRTDVGRQYLGNVAGGEQKVADFILYADFAGEIEGKVLVLYENVRGEQKTLERDFTVLVSEGFFEDPGWGGPEFIPPEEPVSTGPPTWLWIVIAAAAAAVAAVLLVRRHRKKKAAAEAALDEIDDDD